MLKQKADKVKRANLKEKYGKEFNKIISRLAEVQNKRTPEGERWRRHGI